MEIIMRNMNTPEMLLAQELLRWEIIKVQPNDPFTWVSGWKSPIYCDNRLILGLTSLRGSIKFALMSLISKEFAQAQVIAAVATGGIPQGVLTAESLNLPFAYVRSQAKEHGMGNRIEGATVAGKKVVLVEDLISTGGSSMKAVQALREAGAEVLAIVATFTYNLPVAAETFLQAGVKFHALTNYECVLKQTIYNQYVSKADIAVLERWRLDPANWQPETPQK